MKPIIFKSKKATMAVVAAVVTFLLTILPVFFPDLPADVLAQAGDVVLKIAALYLGAQGLVDVATVLKGQSQIEPAE